MRSTDGGASADNPAGDFAPVGDEEGLDHRDSFQIELITESRAQTAKKVTKSFHWMTDFP